MNAPYNILFYHLYYTSQIWWSSTWEVRLQEIKSLCVISGFRRDVKEIFATLGCYAAWNGNSIQTFQDNVSVPSSGAKQSKGNWPSKKGPSDFSETSVWSYHSTLLKIPEERRFKIFQAHRNCLRNNRGYNLYWKGSRIVVNAEICYTVKHCHIPE